MQAGAEEGKAGVVVTYISLGVRSWCTPRRKEEGRRGGVMC